MKRRLFVGNLAPSVEEGELREKFVSLLGPHPTAKVGSVEVRCKNGDNYFGFVDIHVDNDEDPAGPPPFLRKCIDLMNNTKWKGSLIKVQLAKESFLDQLKKEWQSKKEAEVASNSTNSTKSSKPENPEIQSQKRIIADIGRSIRPKRFAHEDPGVPKESDNFDFEIVPNKLAKKDKAKNDSSGDDSEDDESPDGIPRFRGLKFAFTQGLQNTEKEPVTVENVVRPPLPVKGAQRPPAKKKEEVVMKPLELDAHQLRLQRIAGYSIPTRIPDSQTSFPPQQPVPQRPRHSKFPDTEDAKPKEETAPTQPQPKGVVFKKNRQQNSDILRQQSLDNRYGIKNQRMGIIKSSLAQISSNTNYHESTGKKIPKMDSLFGEDGDDQEDYENDFRPKKQFEGAAGQKLLELRGQWGFDDRFKIDERFNNQQDEEEVDQNAMSTQDEKNQQLGILSDLLGTPVQFQPKQKDGKSKSDQHNPVIQSRYDPDNPDQMNADQNGDYYEQNYGKKQKNKQTDKLKNKEKETPAEEPIRSTEPATYKTASNLKSLFSEDSKEQTQGGFSLLATFGQDLESRDHENNADPDNASSVPTGTPRQFWQSNPFKYDSSDDEDDDKDPTKKKKAASEVKKPAVVAQRVMSDFFFKKNDERFQGLEEYFLTPDATIRRIDYDEKRRELKSIVKAKARNAKRKDDKRTLAIKRSIRKRKKYKKTAIVSSSSNAVSVGQS